MAPDLVLDEVRGDDAVRELVHAAIGDRVPLRIVGGGSWLDAGAPVPARRGLSLASDRGIVAYVPGDLTVTVRAGTTLPELAGVLAAHDQWVALDPEGAERATVGAVVATDSHGPAAALYGTARDQVLGMTVVTGRGEVIRPGGRVVKNVAGFDVTRLMVGAWGTLGVITEVTLRVRGRAARRGAMEHLRRPTVARTGARAPIVVAGTERLVEGIRDVFDPYRLLNPGIMSAPGHVP